MGTQAVGQTGLFRMHNGHGKEFGGKRVPLEKKSLSNGSPEAAKGFGWLPCGKNDNRLWYFSRCPRIRKLAGGQGINIITISLSIEDS